MRYLIMSDGSVGMEFLQPQIETQESIIFKLRVHGLSQQLLFACRNSAIQTKIGMNLKSKIEDTLYNKRKTKNQTISYVESHSSEQQCFKKRTDIDSPIEYLSLCNLNFHPNHINLPDKIQQIKQQILSFSDSLQKSICIKMVDLCLQFRSKPIDVDSPLLKEILEQMQILLFKTPLNEQVYKSLVCFLSQQLFSRNQSKCVKRIIIPLFKKFQRFCPQIMFINNEIANMYFIEEQFNQALNYFKSLQVHYTKFSVEAVTHFDLGPISLAYIIRLRTDCYICQQQYEQALKSQRQCLKYCFLDEAEFEANQYRVVRCYLNIGLIYELLGSKHLSKRMFLKAQKIADRSLNIDFSNLAKFSILRYLAFTNDFQRFRNLFEELFRSIQHYNDLLNTIDTQSTFLLRLAKQILGRDQIKKSKNMYFLSIFVSLPSEKSQQFSSYVKNLLEIGQFVFVRKIVAQAIKLAQKQPLSVSMVTLVALQVRVRIICSLHKKAIQSLKILLEKAKLISNCDNALSSRLSQLAALWFQKGLAKMTIFCLRKVIKFDEGEQVLMGKALFIRREYSNAFVIFKNILSNPQNIQNKSHTLQAHYFMGMISIIQKKSLKAAERHFSQFETLSQEDQKGPLLNICSMGYYLKAQMQAVKINFKEAAKYCTRALENTSDESVTELIKKELCTGRLYLQLKKYPSALLHFELAAKQSLRSRGLESVYTAQSFSWIGQTLIQTSKIPQGAAFCVLACRLFRKLSIKPTQTTSYPRVIRLLRLYQYKALPILPFNIPHREYPQRIKSLLATLSIQQHRRIFTFKQWLFDMLSSNSKLSVERLKLRLEIVLHTKMMGEEESGNFQLGCVHWPTKQLRDQFGSLVSNKSMKQEGEMRERSLQIKGFP